MSRIQPPLRPTTLGLIVISCLAASGCDAVTDAIKQGQEAIEQGSDAVKGGGGPMTEDDKLGEKLSGYIKCINEATRDVQRAMDRYGDWVDFEKGLTGKERHIFGLFEIREQKACREGVTKAKTAEPSMPDLEAAADAYIAALDAVEPVVAEAYKYYDEDNYKDDAFAKGLELHPKLMSAFEAFDKADATLRGLVKASNEGLLARELERVEKEEGRKMRFLTKNIMAQAKKLMAASDSKSFETLDLAGLSTALTNYEAAVDEYTKYKKAHSKEAGSITSLSWFDSAADDLKKQAKTLMRRKRDNKPWTKDELGKLGTFGVEGHPSEISKKYNDLVGKSNGLGWMRYQPE